MPERLESMFNKFREYVVAHYNGEKDVSSPEITLDDVFIVWACKTLQNWKALISTTVPDGMYYELTYDGDKDVTYFDAYKKWKHTEIVNL